MLTLLLVGLGVFWAWETLQVVPWFDRAPDLVHPFLVLAGCMALAWPEWRVGLAAAGLVGILHVAVREIGNVVPTPAAVRRKTPRVPTL